MAQRQPKDNVTVNQLLQLVDRLSPEDRQELYRRLDLKSWGDSWRALCAKIDEQNKNLPSLTEAEIVAEMKAVRRECTDERAQSSN